MVPVVQDALFEASRKLDQYDDSRPLAPWLFLACASIDAATSCGDVEQCKNHNCIDQCCSDYQAIIDGLNAKKE